MAELPLKPAVRIGAPQIVRALQDLHPAPDWASFAELADGTGSNKGRTIDLFAMSLWPSHGFRSVAYEVKVSRADFRRELDDPSKRAPWEKLAAETWFAAPVGVIPLMEVPEGWGLMELNDAGEWKRPRRALQRTPIDAWPAAFVASLARRSADPPPQPEVYCELNGRRVTLADVIKVAEVLLREGRHRVASKRDEIDVLEKERRQRDSARLGGLAGAVAQRCGWNVRDADAFVAWYTAHVGVDAGDNRIGAVRLAHKALGELLQEVEARKAS